jgi:hypothetical protein
LLGETTPLSQVAQVAATRAAMFGGPPGVRPQSFGKGRSSTTSASAVAADVPSKRKASSPSPESNAGLEAGVERRGSAGCRHQSDVASSTAEQQWPWDNVSESTNYFSQSQQWHDEHDSLPTRMEAASRGRGKDKVPNEEDDDEHTEYIREQCIVPRENLKSFDELVGIPRVVAFADSFQVQTSGAVRAVSGLLLFGPSGTGKTACAQAICVRIGGTFYRFSAADLPNGKAGAQRIDALFKVALSGDPPAVIFVDECDTVLSCKAMSRVGHFASVWERFQDGLLVIGATNDPMKIAPKLLYGRFERKILVDNPNHAARKALILKQLAQHDEGHILSSEDIAYIVDETVGRSVVNIERLVSTAALDARGMAVACDNLQTALEEEPSDYDEAVASANLKYDRKHGWRGGF